MGNLTFAVGLVAVLVGITYGIQPYGDSQTGWGSPFVLVCLLGGVAVLIVFVLVERRVASPLFDLSLFGSRSFTWGNVANFAASLGRGGLQFVLIVWLQGIWLPQHGYSYEQTPLWAGIYMVPMTVGFLLSAPASGILSDRVGSRLLATVGMLLTALSFALLIALPVDFPYPAFAAVLVLNGIGMGMFSSPNRAEVMNSLPARTRGSGSGMMTTFQNTAMVLSIGFFFSLIIIGFAGSLPDALRTGLQAHGVPAAAANQIAGLPAVAVLFAAFLGYNPIRELLGDQLVTLPPDQAAYLTGRGFFPSLISGPFATGLTIAFTSAIVLCLVGAFASWMCGPVTRTELVGAELAAVAGSRVS